TTSDTVATPTGSQAKGASRSERRVVSRSSSARSDRQARREAAADARKQARERRGARAERGRPSRLGLTDPTAPDAHGNARTAPRSTFRGRFADDSASSGRSRGIVIGWAGAQFWPHAHDDLVDYAFASFTSDVFWPSAYDDIYQGIFGSYALRG